MKKILFSSFLILSLVTKAQTPLTSTPMEQFGDHIFIQLSVDGSEPLDFIFDTGDGLPVIDLDVAKNLNLDLDHESSKTSAQGSVKGALIDHNYIELNGIKLEEDIQLYATSLDHLEISIGRNIDGIIGYDLLHHYAVKLNYDALSFELYNRDSYSYSGSGEEFHFKLHKYIPHITGKVELNNGEKIEGEFYVNTGAGTTLDFNTPFANKNKVIDKTGDHYSYLSKGLGKNETKHYEGRVKSFTLGRTTFENLPIGISQAEFGIQHERKMVGILGNRLLSKFNLVFDYGKEAIYFEKRDSFDHEFHVNACGFELQQDQGHKKYLVHRVYERGPGGPAGIQVDDELIKVNGRETQSMTLPEINNLINKEGTSVTLVFLRKGQEIETTLVLKELI